MVRRHPWGGLAEPGLRTPADVTILGLPYEGGACWRGGAAEAPRRLREISSSSPAVSDEGEIVDPVHLRVVDLGDIVPESTGGVTDPACNRYFARVEETVAGSYQAAAGDGRDGFLLAIGGDHSVNIPLLRGFGSALGGRQGLVSLDAHPDLFDTYDGSPLSSACPLRRALETGHLSPDRLLILGTRSYNREELEFMRERGIRFVPARAIERSGVDAVVAMTRERMSGVSSVYLTIDIDVADPSCAPGTGAPVAGGLSGRQVLDLTRGIVEGLPVRGMDIVEISPRLDPTGATLFLGLQIVFETFAVLARKRRSQSGGETPLSG